MKRGFCLMLVCLLEGGGILSALGGAMPWQSLRAEGQESAAEPPLQQQPAAEKNSAGQKAPSGGIPTTPEALEVYLQFLDAALSLLSQTKESTAESLQKMEKVLPALKALHVPWMEAGALAAMGKAYDDLGDKEKAIRYLSLALVGMRESRNTWGECAILIGLASTYEDLGKQQEALSYYQQSLDLSRKTGDRATESMCLSSIAGIYHTLGRNGMALDYYEKALALADQIPAKPRPMNLLALFGEAARNDWRGNTLGLAEAVAYQRYQGVALHGLGIYFDMIGEKKKAIDYYKRSLAAAGSMKNLRDEATTLRAMGLAHLDLDQFQEALDLFDRALQIERLAGDQSGEARSLSAMSALYRRLGEYKRAQYLVEQALVLDRQVKYLTGEAWDLNSMGGVYRLLGDFQNALNCYARALDLECMLGDVSMQGSILNNIGLTQRAMGHPEKALDLFEQALRLERAVDDRPGEGVTLSNQATLYADSHAWGRALTLCDQADNLLRAAGDEQGQANVAFCRAKVMAGSGDLVKSAEELNSAIVIAEKLRSRFASPDMRASYFAALQRYYEFGIEVLMQLNRRYPGHGYDARALRMNEARRARTLQELLRDPDTGPSKDADPALQDRERELRQMIRAKTNLRLLLTSDPQGSVHVTTLTRELDQLSAEYEFVTSRLREASPAPTSLSEPLTLTASEILALIGHDDLILEYSLGPEHSYVWVVGTTGLQSFELPARKIVEAAARRFYRAITAAPRGSLSGPNDLIEAEYNAAGVELSHMLLGPAASSLGNNRLIVVADGALQFLPFAALPDPVTGLDGRKGRRGGLRPLVLSHEIVCLPSISTLSVMRNRLAGRPRAQRSIAVFANPVFDKDDERVKRLAGKDDAPTRPPAAGPRSGSVSAARQQPAASSLRRSLAGRVLSDAGAAAVSPLPGTRDEALAVASQAPPGTAMIALDFDANLETVQNARLDEFRVVHFATHNVVDIQNPSLSGLVLSLVDKFGRPLDGYLRLDDIYKLKLNADIVVLSACDTASGKDLPGEGIIGLVRAFMYAGAPRVVASLWQIEDVSSLQLMQRFYFNMIAEKKRPAEALRAAQVWMWRKKRWCFPYYWAAFVLQGEWN